MQLCHVVLVLYAITVRFELIDMSLHHAKEAAILSASHTACLPIKA
jgi:hypothetical protein